MRAWDIMEKYQDSPITQQFLERFGGRIRMITSGPPVYIIGEKYDAKYYILPYEDEEKEAEFWDLINKSMEQGENLLLTLREYKSSR